jgi:hypothetical protein
MVLKTTDGGGCWNKQNCGSEGDILYSVFFTDDTTGWVVGESLPEGERCGVIYKTRNGGETWQPVPSGAVSSLRSIFMIKADRGWIAGRDGTILKIVDDANENPDNSNGRVLLQNYPNPFTGATTIIFYLPETRHAVITLYDISGRKIKELWNRDGLPGENRFVFDAGECPCGVYLCRFQSGDLRFSRKLIVIK